MNNIRLFDEFEWLAETGYIRTGQSLFPYSFRDTLLTVQGLNVLKATPKSLQLKEMVGEKLVRLVREGSMELAKEAARAAVALGVENA